MKTLLFCFMAIIFPLSGFSQENEKQEGEIEALKIAFITDALDLTTTEAQKFWPVYNQYNERWEDFRAQMHCSVYDRMDKLEKMSEAEAEKLLEDYMGLRAKEGEWRKNYVKDLKKVISAKRIMMLKKAEYDFHKKLLKEYRKD